MRVRLKLEKLTDLVTRSPISQNHWAMKIGISRGHLSGILNGKHPYPSAKTRDKIIEALEVDFDDLFELEDGDAWTEGSSASFQAAIAERYLIDREVGQGGMGTVYQARDVKHGRLVCIKVINPEAVSGIGIAQFLKEIRYSARLEHPNILTLLDSGEAAGYPYYILPFVRQGSLRDRLRERGALGLDDALHITRDLVAALEYAHENNIVHCDIKPENVLLAVRNHAYLADFGISRAVHAEVRGFRPRGQLDSSAGTPAYVSPEQAAGEPDLDARSDVYSLGAVVYEMLCGSPPFSGTTTMETVARRFMQDAPDVRDRAPEVPVSVSRVIQRAMAVDADRRYAAVSHFMNELEGAMANRSRVAEAAASVARSVSRTFARVTGASMGNRRTGKIITVMERFMSDIKFAIRSFLRQPGFTAAAVVTLALGIGATTSIFSLMHAYLLGDMPFRDAETIVHLRASHRNSGNDRMSSPEVLAITDQVSGLQDVEPYYYSARSIAGGLEPVLTTVGFVGAGTFQLLGSSPYLGRTLEQRDGEVGNEMVALLSYELWNRIFGADSSVLGTTIEFSGGSYEVVGVMPPGYVYPFAGVKIWVPYILSPTASRARRVLLGVGRLAPGVDREAVNTELQSLSARLSEEYPETNDGVGFYTEDLRSGLMFLDDIITQGLLALFGAVSLVLVIACVNVANMMMARSTHRGREIAVRAVLGAGRWRILRQLFTENVLLGLASGVIGVAMAYMAVRPMGAAMPEDVFRATDVNVNTSVLLFALTVSLGTAILFGMVPALQALRADLAAAVREGTKTGGSDRRSSILSKSLVVAEVGLSLALLVASGSMILSARNLANLDIGMKTEGALSAALTLDRDAYPERDNVNGFWEQAEQALTSRPDIEAAGFGSPLPMDFATHGTEFSLPGRELDEDQQASHHLVSPGYFEALSIPLLAGRNFDRTDRDGSQPVVIVSRRFVEDYELGNQAVGTPIVVGDLDSEPSIIVGVVADVPQGFLFAEPSPAIYQPLAQAFDRGAFVVARSGGEAGDLVAPVKDAIWSVDPSMPVGSVRTMEEVRRQSVGPLSGLAALITILATGSLILAATGIYGVIAYSVARRTHEFGVRAALGATRNRIVLQVARQGMTLVGIGLVVGGALSFAIVRMVSGLMFGSEAIGVVGGVLIALVLTLIALSATLVPAVRATRVSPVEALRYE